MNTKCPNCSDFKFSKGITGKWSFGFWNLVVYFFSLTFIFGSPYKSFAPLGISVPGSSLGRTISVWSGCDIAGGPIEFKSLSLLGVIADSL